MSKTGFSYPYKTAEEDTRANFYEQGFLLHTGACLGDVAPGYCEIILPFSNKVDQQNGYFHGGAIGTIADSSSGGAAFTLMEAGAAVLTAEFKINFIAPALGDRLISRGRVLKAGRTLTVCQSDVYAEKDGEESLVATALLTMVCIPASRNKEKTNVAQ